MIRTSRSKLATRACAVGCVSVLGLSLGSALAQSVDNAFPVVDNVVYGLALQADGKLVVAGKFTTIGGVARKGIARLNGDGSVDTSFAADVDGAGASVGMVAVQPDGKILIGGDFASVNGTGPGFLARLNADGTVDAGYAPGVNAYMASMVLQPDGKLVIDGGFSTAGGQSAAGIARLNADGSRDPAFVVQQSGGGVMPVALLPNGQVMAGGYSTFSDGANSRPRIARLNADGSLDPTFNAQAGDVVLTLALQPDGQWLTGGMFATMGGQSRMRVARLNGDGSADAFNPNANGNVITAALRADGKVVIGGWFMTMGGDAASRLAWLNADGSLDLGFSNVAANNVVRASAILADGSLVAAGDFTSIGGQARPYLARITTAEPAPVQTLSLISYSAGGSVIRWSRTGPAPELMLPPILLASVDGVSYAPQGTMQRASDGWIFTQFAPPPDVPIFHQDPRADQRRAIQWFQWSGRNRA